MTVIVNGTAVEYEKHGNGPVVLLLHGWGDTRGTFTSLTNALMNQYSVLSLDLPGFGGTDAPKETFDLEKYALFVSEFLQKIDTTNIFAIIGHSNGGAIAIRGVSAGVLRPDKLVLVASSGVRSLYTGRKKALRMIAKLMKYSTKLLPKRAQLKLKKLAYKKIGSDLFVAENLQDTFKKVISEDVVQESAKIAQPTLLLYGTNDTATPPDYGGRFAQQIENSQLIIMEGADHFLHQTHAIQVNNAIEEFLAR